MQTILDGGKQQIELVPGASLTATVIGSGSFASLAIEKAEGVVSFAGDNTNATGVATAGPFSVTTIVAVYVVGRVSLNVYQAGVGPSSVSGAGNSSFQALGSKVGAFSIDLSLGPNVSFTSTGAITPTFTNTPALNTAQRSVLTITNGGAGVVTWPAGTRWMGPGVVGSAPSLAASGTEKVVIDIINNAGALSYDASYLGRVA